MPGKVGEMLQALPLHSGEEPAVHGTEAALVRAAQDDPAAFGALYDRYLDRVYSYARARTANEEDAADLAHQVFQRALEALPRYRAQSAPFAAWLFRIARNAAIDRHRRRRATVSWDFVPEALQPVADQDPRGWRAAPGSPGAPARCDQTPGHGYP